MKCLQKEDSGKHLERLQAPRGPNSCLFPGRAPLQVWLPRPGPEYCQDFRMLHPLAVITP